MLSVSYIANMVTGRNKNQKGGCGACLTIVYTKIGMLQRRLACPLDKVFTLISGVWGDWDRRIQVAKHYRNGRC